MANEPAPPWQELERLERGLSLRHRLLHELSERVEEAESDAGPRSRSTRRVPSSGDYEAAIRATRSAARLARPGTTVAVVTQGDAAFLELDDRRTAHFPRTPAGEWGGNPADSTEAIRLLEAQRDDGVGALLLPAPSTWWLEHYGALRTHLARYRSVVVDGCAVFDLSREDRPRRTSRAESDPPVVSVLLPVHNAIHPRFGDRWLRETIESVVTQPERVELVIVDDGSVDGTRTALAEYDLFVNVNVVTLGRWVGVGAALNVAAEVATGAILARLSVGDRLARRSLPIRRRLLERSGADVVGCRAVEIDEGGETVRQIEVEAGRIFPPTTMLWRRVWTDLGGYSTDPAFRFAEDEEFHARASAAGLHFATSPQRLYEYRAHGRRVSTSPLTRELHAESLARVPR